MCVAHFTPEVKFKIDFSSFVHIANGTDAEEAWEVINSSLGIAFEFCNLCSVEFVEASDCCIMTGNDAQKGGKCQHLPLANSVGTDATYCRSFFCPVNLVLLFLLLKLPLVVAFCASVCGLNDLIVHQNSPAPS